jgi:hypothetical protein
VITITTTSSQIGIGSLVGLRRTHKNRSVQNRLQGWIRAYSRGPFYVCGMVDSSHVSLRIKDEKGELIHFGSTIDPSLHIGYVEPWR